MKKIDCHMHLTPPDLIRDYKKIFDKEPYWALLADTKNNRFATAEDLIYNLDEGDFDKGVCFGFSFNDLGLCKYVNDYTIEMVKKYPNRLIGHMAISPKAPGAILEARRAYEAGLTGIGELFLSGQHIDSYNKKDLEPLMNFCKSKKIVVNIHSNEPVGHYYPGKVNINPVEIATIAMHFPDNKIVTAHLGGGLPFYELMKEMKRDLKNLYYDTAVAVFLYEPVVFSVLKTIGILDKVVFGSDCPLVSIKRYESYFAKTGLTNEELANILGGNAEKFYGI